MADSLFDNTLAENRARQMSDIQLLLYRLAQEYFMLHWLAVDFTADIYLRHSMDEIPLFSECR